MNIKDHFCRTPVPGSWDQCWEMIEYVNEDLGDCTSLWNLSKVSFLCIWSCSQGSAAYCSSNSDVQQFPASRFVFIRMILISVLSSVKHQKKAEQELDWINVCILSDFTGFYNGRKNVT